MMNSFLLSKWNGQLFGDAKTWDWSQVNSYFFLMRELLVTNKDQYVNAKKDNLIRHCKPHNGKWLDYIVHKEFATLEDWVKDCGGTLGDVLYGVNRVHQNSNNTPKYIYLNTLLSNLGFVFPPVVDIPPKLDAFVDILKYMNDSSYVSPRGNKCLIKKPDGSIVIGYVVDLKYYNLEDRVESHVAVSVPQENPYIADQYIRMSDMPKGMVVYFKTSTGEFRSIDYLLMD
jgi:hypothetical protein